MVYFSRFKFLKLIRNFGFKFLLLYYCLKQPRLPISNFKELAKITTTRLINFKGELVIEYFQYKQAFR